MTGPPSEQRLAELRREARYRKERLQLYRARLYAGRARHGDDLRELERAAEDASDRLRRAEAQAAGADPSA